MESIIQHVALPNNDTGTWGEYDNIDFVLEYDNRSLITNSIRFECDLQVYSDAGTTRVLAAQDIHLDPKAGGHALIQSINTSLSSVGNIENLADYNRLVKMRAEAIHTNDDMMNASKVCELRAPDKSIQTLQCCEKCPKILGGGGDGKNSQAVNNAVSDPDMSLKLEFCLNNVKEGSATRIPYSKSGAVRIGIILERNLGVLVGRDAIATSQYNITNPRIRFMTGPDQAGVPVILQTAMSIKQSLDTAFNNLSCNVPAVSDAVSISFLKSSDEFSVNMNNLRLDQPPAVSQVAYMFNDAQNKLVTYQIKHQVEMLSYALESLKSKGSNSLGLTRLSANNGYLLGLNWGSAVSLANQKFNIQLSTGITADSYIMFSFFHSEVQV